MVSLDASKAKTIDDVGSQFWSPPEGQYHLQIWDGQEGFENGTPAYVEFTFVIMKGTVPGQERQQYKERFYYSEGALPRLIRLAMACKVLQPGGVLASFTPEMVKGRSLIAAFEKRTGKSAKSGREFTGTQIGYTSMWPTDHPDVATVPKDEELIRAWANAGAQQQAPQQHQPVQQQMYQQPAQQAAPQQQYGGQAGQQYAPQPQQQQPYQQPGPAPMQPPANQFAGL